MSAIPFVVCPVAGCLAPWCEHALAAVKRAEIAEETIAQMRLMSSYGFCSKHQTVDLRCDICITNKNVREKITSLLEENEQLKKLNEKLMINRE